MPVKEEQVDTEINLAFISKAEGGLVFQDDVLWQVLPSHSATNIS